MALGVNERAAQYMEHLCTDPVHGYSQPNRQGIGTGGSAWETVTFSDGTTAPCAYGDRDCSSAVIECFAAQGIDVGGASYTGDMRRCMVATGNFQVLSAGVWRSPQRGDILLNEGKHVALALGAGKLGEFLRSENRSIHGSVGDQDGGESVIRALYDDAWDVVLRYVGPSSGDPVYERPGDGYADCSWLQSIVGAVPDNVWGSDTGKRVGAVQLSSAYWGGQFPYGVKYAQSVVGATADGVWGPKSRAAHDSIVRRIQEGFGIATDGIWGEDTDSHVHALHLASRHV